jgi:uncharacterized membrane protein
MDKSDHEKEPSDPIRQEFTLRPHRSLDLKGKYLFYGSLLASGALSNYFILKSGAWPIAIFVDLAIAGAAAGMALSTRSGKEYERIILDEREVVIKHFQPGQQNEKEFRLPHYMLKVETRCDPTGRCEAIILRARGKAVEIGNFLPPDEKQEVADALRQSIKNLSNPPGLDYKT